MPILSCILQFCLVFYLKFDMNRYSFSYNLGSTEVVLANSQLSPTVTTVLPSARVGNSISILAKISTLLHICVNIFD